MNDTQNDMLYNVSRLPLDVIYTIKKIWLFNKLPEWLESHKMNYKKVLVDLLEHTYNIDVKYCYTKKDIKLANLRISLKKEISDRWGLYIHSTSLDGTRYKYLTNSIIDEKNGTIHNLTTGNISRIKK